jgi:predicted RNase H-like nuclease (RuvC/YqgF family)
MTDEELITRLRLLNEVDANVAADRIEALVKDAKAQESEIANLGENLDAQKRRAERLEAALRKAIQLAERPHYGDRGDALDHCFEAIDVLRAALKGDDHV